MGMTRSALKPPQTSKFAFFIRRWIFSSSLENKIRKEEINITESEKLCHLFLQIENSGADAANYQDCALEMVAACAAYIQCVINAEMFRVMRNTLDGQTYREQAQQLDRNRSACHNALIANVNVVNRIGERLGVGKVYKGTEDRSQYGDYALALVSDIFNKRVH